MIISDTNDFKEESCGNRRSSRNKKMEEGVEADETEETIAVNVEEAAGAARAA